MLMLVEVLGHYSKLDPIKIPPEVETRRSLPQAAAPRVHKLDNRLDPATVAELIAAYESGTSSAQLSKTYGIGKASVLKLLREAGVAIRNQGLADHDVPEAVSRYQAGESLARIGDRFDCDAMVVRRALVIAGVTIRPRPGWDR